MNTIGVLGGVGHAATSEYFQRVIQTAQVQHEAVADDDYPTTLVHSISCPGLDETGITDAAAVQKTMIHAAQQLEQAGADFITIPCNTLHLYHDEIDEATTIPVLNLIETTLEHVTQERVLLLASQTTFEHGLYDNKQFQVKQPSALHIVDQAIRAAMSGATHSPELLKLIRHSDVDAVILGCTELPLVVDKDAIAKPVYDTLDILAEEAVSKAYTGKAV